MPGPSDAQSVSASGQSHTSAVAQNRQCRTRSKLIIIVKQFIIVIIIKPFLLKLC